MTLTPKQFREMVAYLRNPPKPGDRRKSARLQVQAAVLVTPMSGKEKDGFTVLAKDMSLEGAGLLSSVALKPNEQVLIHLAREGNEGVYVACTVRHCSTIADGIYAHGVQFNRVVSNDAIEPPADHQGIERIVEAVVMSA